jgi:hypothetical protein
MPKQRQRIFNLRIKVISVLTAHKLLVGRRLNWTRWSGAARRGTRILGVVYVACWIVCRAHNLQSALSTRGQMTRRDSRFPFSASAEVASDDSVELTHVTELSRYGCYLETAKHRTPGTRATIKIMNKGRIFEATATVLYSRPTMGMAVAFREVKPLFRSMLKDWLHQSLEEQNRKPSIENSE